MRQTPHHLHRQAFRQRTSEGHAKHAHFAAKQMNEIRPSAESYSFAVAAMRAIWWVVGQGMANVNSTGAVAQHMTTLTLETTGLTWQERETSRYYAMELL